MIGDECVELWLNKLKLEALENVLGEQGVTERMQEHLNRLYEELIPEEVREQIDTQLQIEYAASEVEKEENRRFSVFHVTEHGESALFLVDERLEFPQAAYALRDYLRAGTPTSRFRNDYKESQSLTRQEYEQYLTERIKHSGRVIGVYDIDLDRDEFTMLNNENRWMTYAVKDVCAAAYKTYRKSHMSESYYQRKLLEHLNGKELTPETGYNVLHGFHSLRPEEISFFDAVEEESGLVTFYLDTDRLTDETFGIHFGEDGYSGYVSAYRDLESGMIRDMLTLILYRSDDTCREYKYQLSPEEKEILLPKMEAFCLTVTGKSLAEWQDNDSSGRTWKQPEQGQQLM